MILNMQQVRASLDKQPSKEEVVLPTINMFNFDDTHRASARGEATKLDTDQSFKTKTQAAKLVSLEHNKQEQKKQREEYEFFFEKYLDQTQNLTNSQVSDADSKANLQYAPSSKPLTKVQSQGKNQDRTNVQIFGQDETNAR